MIDIYVEGVCGLSIKRSVGFFDNREDGEGENERDREKDAPVSEGVVRALVPFFV